MAFAPEDIRTMTTHPLDSPSPDVEAINLYLANAVHYPRVCQTLSNLNVHYALSFGTQEVNGGDMAPQFPGFKDLSNARRSPRSRAKATPSSTGSTPASADAMAAA